MVVGDNRPFIGALITLDPEGLEAWLPSIGLSADTPLDRVAATAAVHDEIQKYVDKANATVSRAESVRKFVVLDTQFHAGKQVPDPVAESGASSSEPRIRRCHRSADLQRQALNRIMHKSVGCENINVLSHPTLLFCLYNFQGINERRRSELIRPAGAHMAEISDESRMSNDTPSAIVSKATISDGSVSA